MSTLTLREVRIVDGVHQRCSDVAREPDAQYRWITVRASASKCGWALGLLSLYAFLSFFAQIVCPPANDHQATAGAVKTAPAFFLHAI